MARVARRRVALHREVARRHLDAEHVAQRRAAGEVELERARVGGQAHGGRRRRRLDARLEALVGGGGRLLQVLRRLGAQLLDALLELADALCRDARAARRGVVVDGARGVGEGVGEVGLGAERGRGAEQEARERASQAVGDGRVGVADADALAVEPELVQDGVLLDVGRPRRLSRDFAGRGPAAWRSRVSRSLPVTASRCSTRLGSWKSGRWKLTASCRALVSRSASAAAPRSCCTRAASPASSDRWRAWRSTKAERRSRRDEVVGEQPAADRRERQAGAARRTARRRGRAAAFRAARGRGGRRAGPRAACRGRIARSRPGG